MLQITTSSGREGPFNSVEETADAFIVVANGGTVALPKAVIGAGTVVPWVGELPAAPAPPPPPVPQSITMRQARLVLLGAGKLAAVDTAIAAIVDEPTRKAAQIEWEFSNELQRNNTFVRMLAPGLQLTEAQVDALFVAGAKL